VHGLIFHLFFFFFFSFWRGFSLLLFSFLRNDTPSVFLIRCRIAEEEEGVTQSWIFTQKLPRRERKGKRKKGRGSQYFDSDSAATPSLGRRVGTEASWRATMLLRYRLAGLVGVVGFFRIFFFFTFYATFGGYPTVDSGT
jgi:hypothetical protein